MGMESSSTLTEATIWESGEKDGWKGKELFTIPKGASLTVDSGGTTSFAGRVLSTTSHLLQWRVTLTSRISTI